MTTWHISIVHTVDFHDTIEVQADTEDEAIEKALSEFEEKPELSALVDVDVVDVEKLEAEVFKQEAHDTRKD